MVVVDSGLAAPKGGARLAHVRLPCRAAGALAEDGGPRSPRHCQNWSFFTGESIVLGNPPTGWCPPVISWFINPINYSYICHKP